MDLINRQLTEKGLKVEKAHSAIVDATIIQTAGGKQRQAIEVNAEGQALLKAANKLRVPVVA